MTEDEYQAAYRVMPEMAQCAMDLAVLTGLRPADVLRLERSNLVDDGIQIDTRKTGKSLLIEWSTELRRVVKRALQQKPQVRQSIICNKQGKPYTVDGFSSNWYRAIRKAIGNPENPLTEPFQFRDLRAKSASDDTVEAASQRLGHTDPGLTDRVYRRKPTRAKPLR